MNLSHLQSLRLTELETVLLVLAELKPAPCRVLEIGAGSGWQAKKLAEHGYEVSAIDLAESDYAKQRVWSVTDYNGKNIPFDDSTFDVVYSSNVLEHIPAIIPFQEEIQRVLKPDGIAVHLLPNAVWRVWTSMAHYAFAVKMAVCHVLGGSSPSRNGNTTSLSQRMHRRTAKEIVLKIMFPHRHGEKGNVITETWFFSRWRWTPLFTHTGWQIRIRITNQLFYTGYGVLGAKLPIVCRRALSKLLGSACHLYILEATKD